MKLLLSIITVLLITSCSTFQRVPSKWAGKEAYTRHGFHYEKTRHITTNYIRGFYVSPGTKLKVMSVSSSSADVMIGSDLITIVNSEKYTNLSIEGILDRMLSESTVKPQVSSQFTVNLNTGQPSIGMTKDEVITIIGYPPAHATASLDSAVWKYWYSKFDTKDLIFEGNKLARIRN